MKLKPVLSLVLKLGITSLALYFVFQKVDFEAVKAAALGVDPWWLLLSLLLYVASKVVSAIRFARYIALAGVSISFSANLRLYFVGMFYNLFLPGGIGGDGYKVFLLRQEGVATKELVKATLLDRLNGLVALALLGGVLLTLLLFTEAAAQVPGFWWWATGLATLLVLPIAFWGHLWLFPRFQPVFWEASLLSFGVQGLQLLGAWALLLALGNPGQHLAYLTLFLVSSAVAVLPLTIGGVGARELVFLYGTTLFGISEATAISFSMLFFFISAVASLPGSVLAFGAKPDGAQSGQ